MVTLCQADADGASYVIPQATGNIWVPISVLDKGTGLSFDDTWELPSTDVIPNWAPGYYYNYSYKATFKGQYIDPDNPGSYNPGFSGAPWQAAAPIGTLNFSRIKDLTISWTNIPGSNNGKQEVFIIITEDEIPISSTPKKEGRPEIADQESGPSLVDGNGEIILLKTTSTNQGVISIHPISSNQGVVLNWRKNGTETWSEIKETVSSESQTDLSYDLKINLDAESLKLEGRQYIYLVYHGGDESGHMKWLIDNFTVTIDSRR